MRINIGNNIWTIACYTILSTTVGISSKRILPFAFGICTPLTEKGVYLPSIIGDWSCLIISSRVASTSEIVLLSIPGAPLLRFTALKALLRLVV